MIKLACDTPLAGRLLEMDRLAAGLAAECDAPEAYIVRSLMRNLPDGALLFSGNSMPIRDIDGFGGGRAAPLRLVANRGVSGIDGNLSTILGLAKAHPGQVVGLIGDLAFWHDHAALLDTAQASAVIVILNNQGGGIFGYLPQAKLPEFEQGWLTPVGLDIADAARLYRLRHQAVLPEAFDAALAEALPLPGVKLIEVRIDREASLAAHRRYWNEVQSAS